MANQKSNTHARQNEQHDEAIIAEMNRLQYELEQLNIAYYDHDSPLVSDAEYDLLLERLKFLEKQYPEFKNEQSPTMQIGGTVADRFETAPHRVPMLSLNDVFSKNEVISFVNGIRERYPDVKFIVEQKIDGLSISLEYTDGILVQALTRGDGVNSGEVVTENIKQISTVPRVLPFTVSNLLVRGEVFMTKKRFEEINRVQEKEGLKTFANPRNSAAGTIRQLDPQVVRDRGLSIFIFNIQAITDRTFATHHESLEFLQTLGFPVSPNYYLCQTNDEILSAIEEINRKRESLPYGIDGAVVKVDSLSIRDELGSSSRVPRWSVAYKYSPEQQQTKVLDLIAQVGRTGRITPMAILEPVNIDGSTVSRATLHNQAYIDALDIRLHDIVTVHKGGDIIPAVIAVDYSKRKSNPEKFTLPTNCPICNAPTKHIDDGANLYCTGLDCPAQMTRKIEYFASKEAMDIVGLGESSVQKLWEKNYLKHLTDIYKLYKYRENLIEEGDIGREKRVDNLLNAIEDSKTRSFDRFITALGITHIGPQTAKNLVAKFNNIDLIMSASEEELQEVPDIGPNAARSIVEFFAQETNRDVIAEFKELGLNLEMKKQDQTQKLPLANLTFVVTGTLADFTRREIKELIEKYGGKVTSAVSSRTNYLIAGANAGSKLTQAESLNIDIISEQDFLLMIK
ncbi:MAG: NAD-dependent DNA ligase LigA [Clostridiaceae bacterium]|nr:NAD-dependent DNA ligase LigA [Clostridiaceae bacterium]